MQEGGLAIGFLISLSFYNISKWDSFRAPEGAIGAVFEGDFALGEEVAHEVGGFKVLLLAQVRPHSDEDLHGLVGCGVGSAGFFRRIDEDAEDAAKAEKIAGGREDIINCRLPISNCR